MRNPYVTGAYVTGLKFYGREDVIEHLLFGSSQAYWVVGTRRVGKTSLLRQLELVALDGERYVPLYWDMQGSDTCARLCEYLVDAIQDHPDRFGAARLVEGDPGTQDLVSLLAILRRSAAGRGRELLLLADETEVLVNIARKEPEAMQRFHRVLTAGAGLRVIFTSTRSVLQLHDVCREWPTSPFLAGFELSQTLGGLSERAAHDLMTQAKGKPVRVDPALAGSVAECTNNHPYLLQLLCSRLFLPDGSLRAMSDEDLQVDPVLEGFFRNDFSQLTPADRRLVLAVRKAGTTDEAGLRKLTEEGTAEMRQRLHYLQVLGYLRRVPAGYAVGNRYLANWLTAKAKSLRSMPPAKTSEEALLATLEDVREQETGFMRSQLNARRARLVELEAIRARSFLSVSPQVLDEIEQVQHSIRELRRLLVELKAE